MGRGVSGGDTNGNMNRQKEEGNKEGRKEGRKEGARRRKVRVTDATGRKTEEAKQGQNMERLQHLQCLASGRRCE